MIRSLKVTGLNGRFDYNFDFNDDLNIITGPNGSGKTTLLKLIWYLTSGNLHRIIPEISLTLVQIRTNKFDLSLQPVKNKVRLKWKFNEGRQEQKLVTIVRQQTNVPDVLNEKIAKVMRGSLFFSALGKLEGNYTSEPTMVRLQEVLLSEFSDALSVGHHRFIPAVSTYGITELLKQKYIAISGDIDSNDKQQVFVERRLLLDELVEGIFCNDWQYDGIWVGEHIILGKNQRTENPNLITLANLSSGERRLLGFLCYNAFSEEETIFINEPESNLHPDWQRLLPRILIAQGTEKQIFLTTRSPYIFTRFSEKRIPLMNNRESKKKF